MVLIDREQGASEAMAAAGYRLHAAVTLRHLLGHWRAMNAITAVQYKEVIDYLEDQL